MKRLNEIEIRERFKTIKIPPLNINVRAVEPTLQLGESRMPYRPDLIVDIEWEAKGFRFVAEIKAVTTPKLLEEAIAQLSSYLALFKSIGSDETWNPMIVTPYLGEKQIERLIESSVSGIDLSGNAILIVPGNLFVCKTGNANRFPSSAPIKNVYRGNSSIVARVMLVKPKYGSVNDVLDELIQRGGRTSLGTVSKVLKALEEDFLISRNKLVRLIDATTLLNNLRQNYQPPRVTRRTIGRVDDLAATLDKIAESCRQSNLLCAVNEPRRYAVFPSVGAPVQIYTEYNKKALGETDFEETERFANIELIETVDPWVYFDRQWELADGVYYTSPLQTYLDLTIGGKREQDAAEQIAGRLLQMYETNTNR